MKRRTLNVDGAKGLFSVDLKRSDEVVPENCLNNQFNITQIYMFLGMHIYY